MSRPVDCDIPGFDAGAPRAPCVAHFDLAAVFRSPKSGTYGSASSLSRTWTAPRSFRISNPPDFSTSLLRFAQP